MEHRAATEEVIRLIPEMEGSSPEEVLIKRAMQAKWAPAQLHKAAQVYNTTATLYSRETSGPNAIPDLIDAPQVVADYVNRTGRSSLKAASSFLSDNSETAEPLDKVASAEVPTGDGDVPYVWSEAPKQASAPEHEIDPRVKRTWLIEDFKKAAQAVIDGVGAVDAARASYSGTVSSSVDKIKKASTEWADENLIGRIARDSRAINGPDVTEQAMNLIGGFAKNAGIPFEELTREPLEDPIIGRDTTGMVDMIFKTASSFTEYATEYSQLAESMENLLKLAHELPDDATKTRVSVMARVNNVTEGIDSMLKIAQARPAEEGQPAGAKKPKYYNASGLEEAMEAATAAKRRAGEAGITDEAELAAYRKRMADAKAEEDFAKAMAAIPGAAAGSLSNKIVETVRPSAEILQQLASPEGALAKVVAGPAEKARREAEDFESELGENANDIRSRANFKRLMINDEILSKADPERVAEAYNSIRFASPEAAADIGILRLKLRQAVQHQGYDIDSATAARKFTAEGSKLRERNSDRA